jgi:hypothetical protein
MSGCSELPLLDEQFRAFEAIQASPVLCHRAPFSVLDIKDMIGGLLLLPSLCPFFAPDKTITLVTKCEAVIDAGRPQAHLRAPRQFDTALLVITGQS